LFGPTLFVFVVSREALNTLRKEFDLHFHIGLCHSDTEPIVDGIRVLRALELPVQLDESI
jgi:hypothetical protein